MKTLVLNLEQLAVESFSPGGSLMGDLEGGDGSDFTICTACPTNKFSCLDTCGLKCQYLND